MPATDSLLAQSYCLSVSGYGIGALLSKTRAVARQFSHSRYGSKGCCRTRFNATTSRCFSASICLRASHHTTRSDDQ
eukprot:4031836-Amphidinium_carterae.1